LIVSFIAYQNWGIALKKHQNPLIFILLTYALWFGLEIAIINFLAYHGTEGVILIILGWIFGIFGAAISRFIVNKVGTGTYITPIEKKINKILQGSHILSKPSEIKITYQGDAKRKSCDIYHNKEFVSSVYLGETITITTNQSINVITEDLQKNVIIPNPFIVSISDGETKYFTYSNKKFIPY
jgi:hypothetical protein